MLLRKGEDSLPALDELNKKIDYLNSPDGPMLPGVKIEKYYDRTDLIHVTTETVRENLVVGMVLVTLILLMFVSNVRSALIVAINIPLAACCSPSRCCFCAANRPISCRSARLILGSSSIRR